MGRHVLASVLAASVLAWSSASQAVSTYVEAVTLDPGTDLYRCLSAAEQAMAGHGLSLLPGTNSVAWSEDQLNERLYYVFCLTDNDVAVFSGSAPDRLSVDAIGLELESLMARFRAAIGMKPTTR